MSEWTQLIRDVPDFPRPGIVFKDIMPVLGKASAFAAAIEDMARPWRELPIDAVLAIEARGFLLGAPLARALEVGLVPLRKPGKLPGILLEQRYALEYGTDALVAQAGALAPGKRVLLVDDVLATGGTLLAARALAQRLGAQIAGASVLMELTSLNGRARWTDAAPLHAALVA
ncbi:MAG: adenine phosphoribosyltransferase [Thermomonas sp.]|uniref:adenine phosphoribosyltransferase n=1 Tax=Thermomonas sp. TaxID=1971895 RepID=UPI001D4BB861|nr:adenine phosphoribosyltransferase [Thermomonas sp.]MBZ0086893.1 adenine phosphoribosyltransferase [Thermomonas sp.]